MFDMMHTPTSRTIGATTNATGTTAHATGREPTGTNPRRTPLRKATLATAAALTLTFGAAEGPAWGKNASGMTSVSRIAPDTIRVEWANGAGGKATVDYLFVDGTYQLMLRDATGHND